MKVSVTAVFLISIACPRAVLGQTALPKLPSPSGPFGVGRVGYDWIDASRPAWNSTDPQAHRELMAYLWYPTARKHADVREAYIPGAKQMDGAIETRRPMAGLFAENWPLIVSGAIYSHAVDRAPVAQIRGRFPVVVFSHGAGGTGFEYTSLIEDLASRGYVVAAIEHTQLGAVVLFPDGRTDVPREDSPPTGFSSADKAQWRGRRVGTMISEGAADVRFVLDRLTELNAQDAPEFLLAGKLDLTRVASMGHSAGAEYAARAGQLDARFKACVDLDGGMVPIAALPDYGDGATMKQPVLFLEGSHPESPTDQPHARNAMAGTPAQIEQYRKRKEEQLESCPPGSYAVELKSPGMIHGSISDHPLLVSGDHVSEVRAALHNLDLIEMFIRAFLDKNLKHAKASLLDGASAPLPEATIRRYGH
jgi:predicted dienelactone hydrolase